MNKNDKLDGLELIKTLAKLQAEKGKPTTTEGWLREQDKTVRVIREARDMLADLDSVEVLSHGMLLILATESTLNKDFHKLGLPLLLLFEGLAKGVSGISIDQLQNAIDIGFESYMRRTQVIITAGLAEVRENEQL